MLAQGSRSRGGRAVIQRPKLEVLLQGSGQKDQERLSWENEASKLAECKASQSNQFKTVIMNTKASLAKSGALPAMHMTD